jgi:4-amino-4-deoxy-L-arabinose transferase-like glycosyltransferase
MGTRLTIWHSLVALACLVILLGLPLPHIDSDAPLSGEIARNILDSGDWLTLHFPTNYHPDLIVDKPPLTFWVMALSIRVAGQTDAALRIGSLLFAILLVLVVYDIAQSELRQEKALLAALVFATFLQIVFSASLVPQHDMLVTLFVALAFHSYLGYRKSGRGWWMGLAGLWTGLAVLTKGVLLLPLVGAIAVVDALVAWKSGEPPRLRFRHLLSGALVFALVAAPWYIIEVMRVGAPFVRVMLIDAGSIGRLRHSFLGPGLVPTRGFLAMALAYVPLLLIGMLPWTGLLPGVLWQGWRSLRAGPPALRLCMVWFALYFLTLSLSQGDRIARYLLPCYPPLAVLAGRSLGDVLDGRTRLRAVSFILPLLAVSLLGAGVVVVTRSYPLEMRFYTPLLVPTLVVLALTILTSAVLAMWGRGRQAIAVAAAGALLSYTVTYAVLLERWGWLWPWPAMGAAVNRLYQPGDRVVVVGLHEAEANFAAYWIRAKLEPVDEKAFRDVWGERRVFALLAPDQLSRLSESPPPNVLVRTPLGWALVTNR